MNRTTKTVLTVGGLAGLAALLAMLRRDDDDEPGIVSRPTEPTEPTEPGIVSGPTEPTEPTEPGIGHGPACGPGWHMTAAGTCEADFDPTKVINNYLRTGDRTGSLYQIQRGDNPTTLAKNALRGTLGAAQESVQIPFYIAAMGIAHWNLAVYSAIWTADESSTKGAGQMGFAGTDPRLRRSKRYTDREYDPDGVLHRWYIGDAFYNHHADNLTLLRGGNAPERTTDEQGRHYGEGRSYGLIWLPKVLAALPGSPYLDMPDLEPPADLQALAPNIYG